MNLLEVLKKNRLMRAVPADEIPRTRPKSTWTGFKPIAASVPKPPSPTLPAENRRPVLRRSKFDRNERARFARGLEDTRRQTRTKGPSGRTNQGAISSLGVEIVKALAFDFYNVKTGRLDPSHETIAAKVGCHVSTVRRQLKAAKALGLLDWVRRAAHFVGGVWKRRSNSYHFGGGTTGQIDKERNFGLSNAACTFKLAAITPQVENPVNT